LIKHEKHYEKVVKGKSISLMKAALKRAGGDTGLQYSACVQKEQPVFTGAKHFINSFSLQGAIFDYMFPYIIVMF